jgi:HlyD family secretion protein
MVVVVALLAGGAAAWAAQGGGNTGYRMAKVVRATVDNNLTVVGTVEPVNNASVAFQVAGQVAAVTAAAGQQVTAGQTLATLDTTALTESVSSDQSSLSSDEAKLIEDEDAQSAAAAATTTSTTTPSHHATEPTTPSGTSTVIATDQRALTSDEAKTSIAQQQEAADLAQAKTTCGTGGGGTGPPSSTTTTTTSTTIPTNTAACTAALEQVSADQQLVSQDQGAVARDEATLAKALGDSSAAPSGSGGSGTHALDSHAISSADSADTSDAAGTGDSSFSGGGGGGGSGGNGSSTPSDSPQQIADDQAAIDTAEANLIDDQQSLHDAQLTSPIDGTVASVGITTGSTVSAGSSTEVIVIIGTQSFEVSSSLTSSQVADVKVGQVADVAVDGLSGVIAGTVAQVGPVQADSGEYTYPVVAALPSSAQGLFSGSTANLTIATGQVPDVVAVPTSAVLTAGAFSYVDKLANGQLTRTRVKVGMVGSIYTQIRSGLAVGQSVVLADLAEAVPSSNTDSLGGIGGGFGGGFGGAGFGGTRQFTVTRGGGAGGGSASFTPGG